MTVLETLRAARALIDTPEKWGQKVDGEWTGTCVSNALLNADKTGDMEPWFALNRVLGLPAVSYLFRWNDAPGRTHAQVMALFDTAISYEEAKEQEHTVTPEPVEVTA